MNILPLTARILDIFICTKVTTHIVLEAGWAWRPRTLNLRKQINHKLHAHITRSPTSIIGWSFTAIISRNFDHWKTLLGLPYLFPECVYNKVNQRQNSNQGNTFLGKYSLDQLAGSNPITKSNTRRSLAKWIAWIIRRRLLRSKYPIGSSVSHWVVLVFF